MAQAALARGRASSFSVIMILFYYLLFYTSITISFQVKQAESKSDCNESFNCGKLGVLGFPLSDNAKCGLFMINCTSSPPFILLGNGHILEVVNIISRNKFSIVYPRLRNLLEERNCISLLTLPPFSPLISFSIYPNISLRSCLKNRTVHTESVPSRGCKTYNRCADVDLCYGDPPEPSNISDHCVIFQMPAVSSNTTSAGDLFQVLSYRFDLELNVSDDCFSCHNKGGTCLTDAKNQFWCKESDRRTVILVSAICASVAFLGLSILLYRCKKKTKGAYLLSRNVSSATPLTSELEFGGRLYFGVPIFPYQELEEATDNFDPSKELGDGGFGTIYYGKLQDGRQVAIKRLNEHNCNRVEQFVNEINILTGLRHPNLVTLYGCTSRRSQELLLVYEYIPNGTVADHLHGKIAQRLPLMWPLRMSIAIETAAALAYLHRSGIIHRDVKTSNILLDKNFCVKVADFGLSKLLPCDVTHISTSPQGTPGYVDPEYHQCYQLTDKSDVYSFGVVLIELISSMPAVDLTRDKYEINLGNLALDRIQRCAFDELIDSSLGYPIDAEVTRMTTSVAELAFQCLQLEQELRPSMEEVLAFLKDIEAGDGCDLKNRKRDNGNGKYCMVEKAMMSRSRSRSWSETKEGSALVLVRGNIDESSLVPVTMTDSWSSTAGSTTTSSIP